MTSKNPIKKPNKAWLQFKYSLYEGLGMWTGSIFLGVILYGITFLLRTPIIGIIWLLFAVGGFAFFLEMVTAFFIDRVGNRKSVSFW